MNWLGTRESERERECVCMMRRMEGKRHMYGDNEEAREGRECLPHTHTGTRERERRERGGGRIANRKEGWEIAFSM